MKMGESRRLPLRAWLEGILNEGRVPGVEWLDKDTRTFKIPWKRNISDQSSRSDDLQIFLEWAKHTGTRKDEIAIGGRTEYTTWKTRLRSAINKAPDIETMKDSRYQLTSSTDEPFKVFKFKPVSSMRKHGYSSPDTTQFPSSSGNSPASPASLQGSYTNDTIPVSVLQYDVTQQPLMGEAGKLPSDLEAISGSGLITDISTMSLSEALDSRGELEDIAVAEYCPPPGPACPAALPLSSAMPVDHDVTVTTSELPQTSELPPTFLSMLSDTNVSMSSDHVLSATTFAEGDAVTNGNHHLNLQIFYCGEVVREETVKTCHLYHGEAQLPQGLNEVSGSEDVCKVEMPSVEVICRPVAGELIQGVRALLSSMLQGLVVYYDTNGDIYVNRYCRAVVFAESADNVTIQRLARDEVTKVFDQAKFEKHLTEFNNGRARQPSSEVVLVIGQKPNNDRSRYLMYVKVTGSKAANQLKYLRPPVIGIQVSDEFVNIVECSTTTVINTGEESMDMT